MNRNALDTMNKNELVMATAQKLWQATLTVENEIVGVPDEPTQAFFRNLAREFLILEGKLVVECNIQNACKFLEQNGPVSLEEFDDVFAPRGLVLREAMERLIPEIAYISGKLVLDGKPHIDLGEIPSVFGELLMWKQRAADLERQSKEVVPHYERHKDLVDSTERILSALREGGSELRSNAFSHVCPIVKELLER